MKIKVNIDKVYPADISDDEGAEWILAAHHHAFPRMHEIRVDKG
jgi:putative transposase